MRSCAVAGGSATSANGRVQAQTTDQRLLIAPVIYCSRASYLGRSTGESRTTIESGRQRAEVVTMGAKRKHEASGGGLASVGARPVASCKRPCWRGASRQS